MWYPQMWRNTQVSIQLLQAKYKTIDPPLKEKFILTIIHDMCTFSLWNVYTTVPLLLCHY